MSHIFVTDLDGTLLRNNTSVSAEAAQQLTSLIEAEVPISIATARSIVSVQSILGHIPFSLPIVCANGAYVTDFSGQHRSHVQTIPRSLAEDCLELSQQWGFSPMLATYNGQTDAMFLQSINNPAIEWYVEDRRKANDKRLQLTHSWLPHLSDPILNMNIMAQKPDILHFRAALQDRHPRELQYYLYEGVNGTDWHWLSMYAQGATKGLALTRWLEEAGHHPNQLVVFGDQLNDLSMFEVAGHAVAVSEAHPELKAIANEVIGSNETDSVVRYLQAWSQR